MFRVSIFLMSWAMALSATVSSGQELTQFPKNMPGVVTIPHLPQTPTQTVKPVYPAEAQQHWQQGTVVLDVVFDTNGNVEALGCDAICKSVRPDLVQSAAAAVKQWKWQPVQVKGKTVRVRTRVSVDFALDASTPPISVCTVFHDPKYFDGKVVNVSGTLTHVAGVNNLTSKDCEGTMVIADGDSTPPDRDAKYAAMLQAISVGSAKVTLRGLIHPGSGPGQLAGQRLVLQRVLRVAPE
jgi:TonB family protein